MNHHADMRIIAIDNNPEINQDIIKILTTSSLEEEIFGVKSNKNLLATSFKIDTALHFREGIIKIKTAIQDHNPYMLAFLDIHTEPNKNEIASIEHISQLDNNLQIIICTDLKNNILLENFKNSKRLDNLLILKKPFDNNSVRQLAYMLIRKWQSIQEPKVDIDLPSSIKPQIWRMSDFNENTFNVSSELENDLHLALNRNEFFLCYQPEFDIKSNKLVAVEALIRWKHPRKGIINPLEFIPLAEKTNLIIPIGEWVMRTACKQHKRWLDKFSTPFRLAINVSTKQFDQPNFSKIIQTILDENKIKPEYFEIELTEAGLVQHSNIIPIINELKKTGIKIGLDNFGTGFSSIYFLKKIPIDHLKIDKSHIKNIETNCYDEVMIQAILTMAHSLNLAVTAEGVETDKQLKFLEARHCDEVQGFYYSKPLLPEELEDLINKRQNS